MIFRLNKVATVAIAATAAATSLLSPSPAQAQGVASEQQLQSVTVTGTAVRSPLDANLPSTTASKTSAAKGFEGSVRIAAQSQKFDLYGDSGTFNNTQASALLGDRSASGLWWRLMLNRQDSTSQPMQWLTVDATPAGTFTPPAGTGAAVPVTGVRYDTGPKGFNRAVFGANAGAVDHTIQRTVKVTVGYQSHPFPARTFFGEVRYAF